MYVKMRQKSSVCPASHFQIQIWLVFNVAIEVIFNVKNRHGCYYKYKFTSRQQPVFRLL